MGRSFRMASQDLNRTIFSLLCASENCPSLVAKPCWLTGQRSRKRQFGVDVVGHLLSEIGLGEAARLLIGALDEANIPTGLINVPLEGRMSDTTLLERLKSSDRHSMAMSVLPVAYMSNFADRICRGQTNFAYAYCELPTVPESWKRRFDWFDAYWAPTTFVADMLMAHQDRPVHLIRQPVQLPKVPPPPQVFAGRLKFYTFFDFDSYLSRKNPMGAIKAFQAAFPKGTEDVSLLIKARGKGSDRARRDLHAMAEADPRIMIKDGLLSRAEMTALMADANVFVSLHRSEGFGLGCAEALAQGKIVVATDFGGTRDFISAETGFPVSYRPVSLTAKDYLGAEGSHWAEPDIDHAAVILKDIYENPASAAGRSQAGFLHLQQHNSFVAVARTIRTALL